MSNQSANKRIKPQVLSGFRDQLPAQMLLRRALIERFRTVFERHGFEPIETPVLEHLEILTGKAGENEKLMYHFLDHGDRPVGMRYDLTVPLARFAAQHESELAFPFKRYHIAPVWRAEKAQRGRLREFYQCDADVIGSASLTSDAVCIAMVEELLSAASLPNIRIRISHRQLLAALARSVGIGDELAAGVFRSIDKLDKIGRDAVSRELADAGAEPGSSSRLLDLISPDGGDEAAMVRLAEQVSADEAGRAAVADLRRVLELIAVLSSRPEVFELDPALARGLDYYTGIVYEATVDEPKVGSVSGGGRYDGLVSMFSGRPVPANGISIGLERILEVVNELGLLSTPSTVCDAIVIYDEASLGYAAEVAKALRASELNIDLWVGAKRGIGEQAKYASRRGIPFAVIVGGSEAAIGSATLRDLTTGEQVTIPAEQCAAQVLERTAARAASA